MRASKTGNTYGKERNFLFLVRRASFAVLLVAHDQQSSCVAPTIWLFWNLHKRPRFSRYIFIGTQNSLSPPSDLTLSAPSFHTIFFIRVLGLYNPCPQSQRATMKSRSIPIVKSLIESQQSSEAEQEALLADYKDYVFYSRLITGLSQKQLHTQDVSLRYQNQALIDHIIDTRHERSTSKKQRTNDVPYSSCGMESYQVLDVVRNALSQVEEDLIFDLEL